MAQGRLVRSDRLPEPHGWPAWLPARIVQYWHDEVPPEEVRHSHARVVARHPGVLCELYSRERAREFLAAHFAPDVLAAFDHSVHEAMRCDIFRLCHVLVHGGMYLDVDIDCEGGLGALLPQREFDCFLLFWRPGPGQVVIRNDVIAAPPGSALLARLLDVVIANVNAMHAGERHFSSVRMVSGPGALTRLVAGLAESGMVETGLVEDGPRDGLLDGLVVAPWAAAEGILQHERMSYETHDVGNWRSWHGE